MSVEAAYLPQGGHREPWQYTPELSRRARGVEIWAALKSLGRSGLADLIERNCRLARRFAEALQQGGCEILNGVGSIPSGWMSPFAAGKRSPAARRHLRRMAAHLTKSA
jgi:glutamate/tyrosine decarboxylase-like PLP-dependent enzyme